MSRTQFVAVLLLALAPASARAQIQGGLRIGISPQRTEMSRIPTMARPRIASQSGDYRVLGGVIGGVVALCFIAVHDKMSSNKPNKTLNIAEILAGAGIGAFMGSSIPRGQ